MSVPTARGPVQLADSAISRSTTGWCFDSTQKFDADCSILNLVARVTGDGTLVNGTKDSTLQFAASRWSDGSVTGARPGAESGDQVDRMMLRPVGQVNKRIRASSEGPGRRSRAPPWCRCRYRWGQPRQMPWVSVSVPVGKWLAALSVVDGRVVDAWWSGWRQPRPR